MTELNGPQGWAGVVLAGGRSSRMGQDKALMAWQGKPLVTHALDLLRPQVEELLIIGDPATYGHLGPLTLADDWPGQGPLGGILTALRYALNDDLIVLACDMPNLNGRFLERLVSLAEPDYDAVVAQCDGRLQPLAGVYRRRCRAIFAEQLDAGERKMSDALERVHTRYVQVCPGEEGWPQDLFRNINTPSDL